MMGLFAKSKRPSLFTQKYSIAEARLMQDSTLVANLLHCSPGQEFALATECMLRISNLRRALENASIDQPEPPAADDGGTTT